LPACERKTAVFVLIEVVDGLLRSWNTTDSLSSFAKAAATVLDPNSELQSLCEGLKQPADAPEGKPASLPADFHVHLVGDAYKSIHKFLLTFGPLKDQLRSRMERVMAPDGDVEWVSTEGEVDLA
jgi:hypothetical protein